MFLQMVDGKGVFSKELIENILFLYLSEKRVERNPLWRSLLDCNRDEINTVS